MFRPVSGLNSHDSEFLTSAVNTLRFEIESAKLASLHGSSAFTKEYASEMTTDHESSLEELKQVCTLKGVPLPDDLPVSMQHTINYLAKLDGAEFDQAYRRSQINGHSSASTRFKDEIDNGRDEDVKGYAVKTLPAITTHYKMALTGQTTMGSTRAEHGL